MAPTACAQTIPAPAAKTGALFTCGAYSQGASCAGPNSPNYISSKAWVSGQFTVAKFLVSLIKSFKKLGLLGQRNSLLLWPIVCLEIVYLGIFFPLLIKAELKHRLFESGDNDYKNPFAFSCFTADRCALCGGGEPALCRVAGAAPDRWGRGTDAVSPSAPVPSWSHSSCSLWGCGAQGRRLAFSLLLQNISVWAIGRA